MKKSRKLLFTLLAALLVFCVVFAVACEPPANGNNEGEDNKTETTSETALIPNGTFATATGTSSAYIKTNVTGWSIATDKGSWLNTAANLNYGVVDLDRANFDTNKNALNSELAYPGIAPNTPKDNDGKPTDTNALAISMARSEKYGSIYFAASKSVTVAANKYYKLSIDVWTDILTDEDDANPAQRGAALVINGDVFTEYLSVNTEQQWKTYEIFIEGNNFESRTFSIQLWLGHGPSTLYDASNNNVDNPYLAKGTVMFDNVTLTELTVEDGACAEYKAALTANYNALITEQNVNTEAVGFVRDESRALGVNVGTKTVVSLIYPDINFTAYRAYDAATTNRTYIKPYYTAKVGDAKNYTWILGKENLSDSSQFPTYTTISDSYNSYSSDPRGIFDMAKLYSYERDDDDNLISTDTFNKLQSDFVAPKESDFFNMTTGKYIGGSGANSLDSEALLIYHMKNAISGAGYVSNYDLLIESNKYYELSVWVYAWVPDYAIGEEPEDIADPGDEPDENDEGYNDWKTQKDKYLKHQAWVEKKATHDAYIAYNDSGVKPVFRLTGATTNNKLVATPEGQGEDYLIQTGKWTKLTIKVKGNELANRQLRMEFWYGEGEWASAGLYPGGCFFDDLSIKVYDSVAAEDEADYQSLTVLNKTLYDGFNLTPATARDEFTAITNEGVDGWQYALIDDKTSADIVKVGFIGGNYADGTSFTNAALAGITPPGTFELADTKFDVVMLNHTDYTASSLTFMPSDDSFMEVSPNKFYRLSMWVNTENLAGSSNFKVSVYDRESKEVVNSSAVVSSIAVKEWTEISILIKGSATASKKLYLYFEFGSGNIYNPASHTKGAIFVTACTFTPVEYSEYNTVKTGTYVKKVALTESTSSSVSSSNISNSDFASISDSDYSDKDKVNDIFDENTGDIIGVATPSSWTLTSPVSPLGAVTVTIKDSNKLTWSEVNADLKPDYYVFMNGFEKEDKSKEDNVLVGVVNHVDDLTEYSFTAPANGTYYVRAKANVDGKDYISAASSNKTVSGITGTATKDDFHDYVKEYLDSAKAGVINADTYKGSGLGADFYIQSDKEYRSTASKNLLMITSPYETNCYYKSTQSTLSADSYYRLSVWVKTVDGAKASITLANNSNALAINRNYDDYGADESNDYIGYVNIDTQGKWVRYDLYISTNMSSAALNLELGLGNKYAKTERALSEDEKATKVSYGLSSGTVYFDDIMLTKLDNVKAFNNLVYGIEDIEIEASEIAAILEGYGVVVADDKVADLTVDDILAARENKLAKLSDRAEVASFFTNRYKFKVVNYFVNSFDNYTEDSSSDNSKLGYTPSSYNHHNAYSATAGSTDAPNIIYGVYDKTKIEEAFISYIRTDNYALAAFSEDEITSFLTENIGAEGNNMYLMMANVREATGQYYQSTSYSMSSESYYKITFRAKLLSVDNKNAEFRLVYDNTNGYWAPLTIKPSDDMLEYTFYYYNESTSSQSLYLNFTLGSNDAQGSEDRVKNDVAGILIVDDVAIAKLSDETEYAAAVENTPERTATYKTEKVSDDKDDGGDKEGGEDKKDNKEINPQVWLIVSSVLIGVILIAVIVVLMYRKLKGRVVKKLRKTKVESNVPVDLATKANKPKIKGEKRTKDIQSDDYDD